MRFFGNEICCGSYACLNAMQDPMVDLQLFEISTSTPFGLKHCENNYFDRLITTFCDPNNGMDRAEYSGLRVPPIRNGIPTKRRMIPTSFLHAIRRNVLSVRK